MTSDRSAEDVWADAQLAAGLLAIDPVGLGGAVLRSGPGAVRDAWLAALQDMAAGRPIRRVPLNIQDERLLGGLDLTASLAARRAVAKLGVLAQCHGGLAVLAMAERLTENVAARVTAVLDAGEIVLEREGLTAKLPACLGLVALDEGLTPDERPPAALMDRLAFNLDLTGLSTRDVSSRPSRDRLAEARARLAEVAETPPDMVAALCSAAHELGLTSLRTPLLALRVARAHAAWQGRSDLTPEDAAVGARLVLLPRALRAASSPEREHSDEAPPPDTAREDRLDTVSEAEDGATSQADRTIAAVKAELPERLFNQSGPAP
ncbi:MAG: hypothetical protein ACYDD1_17340, partial [Caulobacteraceae bacterium]